jgi:hypothetical protein
VDKLTDTSISENLPMNTTCLAIRLAALVAIVLHLMAGSLLPEEVAWSVWPYTAFPAAFKWLAGLAVAFLALTPVTNALDRSFNRLGMVISKMAAVYPFLKDRRLWFGTIAASMAVPFWLLRIRHLRWGDADFIVKALSYTGADRPVWTIYNWQAPLSIFTHAQLWFILNPVPGVGVDTLYAITSVLSGVGFVYVLFLLADSLGRHWSEKATVFGLVITTGSMQLFFGYVENYTVISLGLTLTLYLGVRCLRGKISLVWPSLVLAVTNAFHPSTIVLWPAMGYIGLRLSGRRPSVLSQVIEWAKLALPPVLVLAILVVLMTAGGHGPETMLVDDRPGGADGIPFVPLYQVTTEWQHYTMFSLAHLLDWVNEHFLISPFGLFLLLLALVTRIGRRNTVTSPDDGQSRLTFLAIAGLAYLLLTFVWNPDYGGRNDWDLFAPSAFVYTPLAACLLVRRSRAWAESSGERCFLGQVVPVIVAASALHTMAWIYYNAIP